jgi:hypothetical protein
MAFIKPYYDQDHNKERSEHIYGRIKSLELIEKELQNRSVVNDHSHHSQRLADQRVMDQLDQVFLYPKQAQSFSSRVVETLKGINAFLRRLINWFR